MQRSSDLFKKGSLDWNIALLSWLALNVFPIWLASRVSSFHALTLLRVSPDRLVFVCFQLLLILLSEVFLFSLLIFLSCKLRNLLLRSLALWAVNLLVAGYCLWWALSWIAWYRYGAFLDLAKVGLVRFLTEPVTLRIYMNREDLLAVALAGVAFLIYAQIGIRFIRSSFLSGHLDYILPRFGRTLIISLLISAVASRALLSLSVRENLSLTLKYLSSPQGIIAARLVYATEVKTYSNVELNLEVAEPYQAIVPKKPKNVLILVVEALRHDAVFGADETIAPYLRELAKSGHAYLKAYSQASDTEYSLNTIFTGLYPLKFPERDLGQDSSYPQLSLWDLFNSMGYRSAYFTSFQWRSMEAALTRYPGVKLFDPTVDGGAEEMLRKLAEQAKLPAAETDQQQVVARVDDINTDRLIDWVSERNTNQPFFASFYFYSTHFPYTKIANDATSLARNRSDKTYFFPATAKTEYWRRYLGTVNHVDALIGRIVTELKKLGIYKDTLLIVTGDHGEEFYEHGGCLHVGPLHEEVQHIPLIFAGATEHCQFRGVDELTGHIDIAPTILGALSLTEYKGYQGENLCEPASMASRAIFASTQALTDEDAVLYQNWKLVRNLRGLGYRLFDKNVDPEEHNNLYERQPIVSGELRELLQSYRNRQLTYFGLPKSERDVFYPPKIQSRRP